MTESDGRMPPETHKEFKRLRDQFLEALEGYDVLAINEALMAHPDNQRKADEHNEESVYIIWKDCPLYMTACYYANNKLEIEKMPMYEIEELKAILDKNND